ncbi:MAG: phosphoenolpyruvate synthase [Solirubrobacterales bacterium]
MQNPVAQTSATDFVRSFAELSHSDVDYAGGKGANLGELTGAGIPVPAGFVVGAPAYAAFCDDGGLRSRVADALASVDVDDPADLDRASGEVRKMIEAEPFPEAVEREIRAAYAGLVGAESDAPVAVRSSATAEDTESASFAGMNETFLNVRGAEALVEAVRKCWSSLFGSRTLFYRAKRGFGQADMDIAVVVQRQIQSTRSGVMFTIDPASGAIDRLVIEGSFGLGEAVVSGSVSPDRYLVEKESLGILAREVKRKELVIESLPGGGTRTRELEEEEALRPVLSDEEVRAIADLGRRIEQHYGSAQDTEWAFDDDGSAWMLQSRPVTSSGGTPQPAAGAAEEAGPVLLKGLGAAPGAGRGTVRIVRTLDDASAFSEGEILVTHMTAPDWVPLMRKSAAIVTDSGGMTCHAAIVSRELGIPCVVGTADATSKLRDGELVTVDATHGSIHEGAMTAAEEAATAPAVASGAAAPPITGTKLLVNLSEPSQIERVAELPVDGIGLLRAELMVLEALEGKHPRQLLEEGRGAEFSERMGAALSKFSEAFAPRPITYRTIDFRTNEFRGLEGGDKFEPEEANPMIGFRGALRYTQEPDLFRLELDAIRHVWDQGHTNFHVMLPFVRTARELETCRRMFDEAGLLERRGFELWVMAEVPSVLFNLASYAELGIAGISIGSNDLTQLVLGSDRDSAVLAETFDERDPAVVAYLRQLIPRARELGLQTSICGQAPSVHPEYAQLLVETGIDAISVNIDSVDRARRLIGAAEQRMLLDHAR